MNKYAEYLCYIFGDDPNAIRLITSFTSLAAYTKNTEPYETPVVLETSCLLGFNRTTYRVVNPLERSLFEVLRNMGKVSLYDYVVESIRRYNDKIVFMLGLMERLSKIDSSATNVEQFLSQMRKDFDTAIKKFVYFYLMSIDEKTIREWFASSRGFWDNFENEVLQLVRNMREATADCCGSIARDAPDVTPDEGRRTRRSTVTTGITAGTGNNSRNEKKRKR